MAFQGVVIPAERVADFCRRHGVSRLSLFGSVLRDDFGPRSDVDILVEFEPGAGPGLFGFAGMQIELSGMLGRSVHLHTPPMLGPLYPRIAEAAEVQYAA